MTIITAPGAYSAAAVPIEAYHGAEICPGPSISATGLKIISQRSPLHYWWQSSLNPARPAQDEKRHFAIGKACHDMLLLGSRWPDFYHITPDGFSRAKTKAMAEDIEAADAAIAAGKTVLNADDAETVRSMAASLLRNSFARAALTNGEAEVTLAWQDKETGVWCRARPDFLPHKRKIIPDLKTAADGRPDAFARAIGSFGYHIAAAHYMAGIEAIYGERPTNWLHVVIEKEAPYAVSLYELPAEDIEIGEDLRRRALRTFADCLTADRWPAYAADVTPVGLAGWARKAHAAMLEREAA
jgi:PDDEXK-like domain of unknown function (DUF3799)